MRSKTCRECGEDVVFRAKYKHAKTGKWMYARTYGIRAFRFCGCKRR